VNFIASYLLQCCDVKRRLTSGWVNEKTHEWLGPTISWVNGLFLRERTKTSRNVTISFSQSPERATATRGRVQLVFSKCCLFQSTRIVTLTILAFQSFFHTWDIGESHFPKVSVQYRDTLLNVLSWFREFFCLDPGTWRTSHGTKSDQDCGPTNLLIVFSLGHQKLRHRNYCGTEYWHGTKSTCPSRYYF
jgi:hypothetical protein